MHFPFPAAPNFQGLVSAEWLHAVFAWSRRLPGATRPPTLVDGPVAVIEVSWAPLAEAAAYHAGHIPGAIHLDTDAFEDGYPTWRLRPPAELQAVIGGLGITPSTTVVVYSHQPIAAARAWWVMRYAGVADVRILNGGYASWAGRGFASEDAVNEAAPGAFATAGCPEMLASPAYVRDRLAASDAWLADARSVEEFDGLVSGYDYLDRRGRLPSALHIGDAADDARLYTNADGTFRHPAEALQRWAKAGIVATASHGAFDREVIIYCGSGWRSSAAVFAAWLMGYENVRNFSDGWCGWSTRYVRDEAAVGSSAGWRQEVTANPVVGPDEGPHTAATS